MSFFDLLIFDPSPSDSQLSEENKNIKKEKKQEQDLGHHQTKLS